MSGLTSLDLPTFIARWQASTLSERSSAQSHFIDLCALLEQPTPAAIDPTGEFYTFEKGIQKAGGGKGWADVWKRDHFGWEYKSPGKDLQAAYNQLLRYRESLENPPLLVVCDLTRFQVHTNFNNAVSSVYDFTLNDLAKGVPTETCRRPPLEVLRDVFTQPGVLRPGRTRTEVTEAAAAEFATLSASLRKRGYTSEDAAPFLMRLLFCLFAEDKDLLPSKVFTRILENAHNSPAEFDEPLRHLFATMAHGGWFGAERIPHFNGGLFTDDHILELTREDLATLLRVSKLDWGSIEPTIFGVLFERSLDPAKRTQLGAHYTSREDIMLIVEPVLMAPLRRQWLAVQEEALAIVAKRDVATTRAARTRSHEALRRLLFAFAGEIGTWTVLDPACGSGNFLYVALKRLLDLWKEVSIFGAAHGLELAIQYDVTPRQLYGIEHNVLARELASVVVWIGYIQWLHDNGFGFPPPPILRSLDNIQQRDAILAYNEAGQPVEPSWPEVKVIVGNPPFLGGSKLRRELGDEYTEALWRLYEGRVPHAADLVSYWVEQARARVEEGTTKRVGLLATQSIRAGANRTVLERIKATGDIFIAWSDRPWVLEGAAVRVSMIAFDNGTESHRMLNGTPVQAINTDLTGALDLTIAQRLPENQGLSFEGVKKHGSFDLTAAEALCMIKAPVNPNGCSNADVVWPLFNGLDLLGRPRETWVIDFGTELPEAEAALYEVPFEYVKRLVKPERDLNNRESYRRFWWRFGETRPEMRRRLAPLVRYIATTRVAKHRLFSWLPQSTLPDSRLYVFAREDDYFFGVLHSRVHEVWSLATSSRHGDGISGGRPTYNNSTCFETFPLPWPPGQEPAGDPRVEAISTCAQQLATVRDRWLTPEGATPADLATRTLTNLYNQRPTWLDTLHRLLDRAVLDAYGWPHDLTDEQLLERLLALNLERAVASTASAALPLASKPNDLPEGVPRTALVGRQVN